MAKLGQNYVHIWKSTIPHVTDVLWMQVGDRMFFIKNLLEEQPIITRAEYPRVTPAMENLQLDFEKMQHPVVEAFDSTLSKKDGEE